MNIQNNNNWLEFDEIPEPKMINFGTGNGSGSKLLQSYLDGHPEIYMIPGYQLLYFYPHWYQWKEELKDNWNWKSIIDIFCIKHASVIDSRRIPANDGMANLGKTRDQWLELDETLFKNYLLHLIKNKPFSSRIFLLAVHYAYSYCRNEDLLVKKCLVYHIHVHEYVPKYLEKDFPDMLTIAMVRDPRSNIDGRYRSTVKLDAQKLDYTDSTVYLRRTYYFIWEYLFESMQCLKNLPPENVRVVRHEDMHYSLKELMHSIANFLGISFHKKLLECTFGGLLWWGSNIYSMQPMNKPNPRVISMDWQKKINHVDWFVIEGLFHDYILKYGYQLSKHKSHTILNRVVLCLFMILPSSYEIEVLLKYINPKNFINLLNNSYHEFTGIVVLKDYTFNAYYRHKWYNRGLNLWEEKWHKKMIFSFLRLSSQNSNLILRKILLFGSCQIYLMANSMRYLFALFVYPFWILKRILLSTKVFLRLLSQDNCLPKPIMANTNNNS